MSDVGTSATTMAEESRRIESAPNVFLSYRRDDTRETVAELSARLRTDIGAQNVFRDEDNLIAGQLWRDAIEQSLAASDAAVFLVGPDWVGDNGDGSRRIDEDDDPVRIEVAATLAEDVRAVPVPVLVDRDAPPPGLPESVEPLFGDRHYIRTTHGDLTTRKGTGYQHLLVGVWEALRALHPGSVLVIGDDEAQASLDAFVDELKRAKAIDAQRLSRFAAGAYLVTPRRLRAAARRWPDAIIVGSSEQPSPVLQDRAKAVDEHPSIKRVALVGAGLLGLGGLGGFAAAQAAGAGSSAATAAGTAVAGHAGVPELVATLPNSGSALSGFAAAWGNATLVAKLGIAAVAIAVGGGGIAVAVSNDGPENVEYADNTTVATFSDDERSYPLGDPGEALVLLGPGEPAEDSGSFPADLDASFVSRDVAVVLPGIAGPLEIGSAVLPETLPTDYLETAGDGVYRAARVSVELGEGLSGLPAFGFCFEVGSPSNVVGGWRHSGGPATIVVEFVIEVENSSIAGTSVAVIAEGPGVREMIVDVPEDFDLTRCPVEREVVTSWIS